MAQPTPASDGAALPSIVGVVGAGTMGAGIAQVALEAGCEVVLYDVDEAAVERGIERIRDGLTRRASKLDLDPDATEDWMGNRLGRVRHIPTLDGLADEADLVIESAIEDLALKRTIFRTLDDVADPEIILATNTSALSVAEIARATTRPERVIGLHFFNPAPVMTLVEVIAPPLADPAVVARAVATITAWGKTPVVCADRPGFIVNRVNRPFTIEALRILESGAAGVTEIDAALREDGFPMGPFELMDLTGIDVTLAAATGIWEGLGQPHRLRPSPIQQRLVEAGDLGRKTGRGFYHYVDGRRADVAETSSNVTFGESLSPAAIRQRILDAIAEEA
ncbi:MAG: 3-hydroxyacyl-CoA dehydrogenase NAD-binding domain-containing protein, partial [Chloroflexota bacterium]